MRSSTLRWSLLGTTLVCLSVISLSGCKSPGFSMPSTDWLSWGKKKPSATALSKSSLPTRPSAGALPNPAASTASTAQPAGSAGSFASAGASYPSPAYGKSTYGAQPANGGFYTGPYGTGAPPAGGSGGTSQNGYPAPYSSNGLAPANQGSPSYGAAPSYGAGQYPSPYQAAGNTASANAGSGYGYRTADSRGNLHSSEVGPSGGSNQFNSATTSPSPPSGAWNSDGWRRGGDPYSGAPAAPAGYGQSSAANTYLPQNPYPPTGSPQGGYGAASPSGRGAFDGGAESPYRSSGVAFGAASNNVSEASSSLGAARDGVYRPGSTARNGNAFTPGTGQSGQAAAPSDAAGENGGFDQASGGVYPNTATSSQPANYGGYSYPNTGQYR